MKRLKIHILMGFALIMTFGACESLLDTEPRQSISNETALEDFAGVQAVMVGVYHDLQSATLYGRNELVIPDLLADNLRIALQNSNRLVGQANNDERDHMNTWNTYYALINSLNNVLVFVDGIGDGTQAQIDQQKGEAHFLRALAYHNLVRTYAREPNHLVNVDGSAFQLGVPLVELPFSGVNESAFPERETVNSIYNRIEDDLLSAISLLDNSRFPNYGSQIAAQALLARVYLYQEKWKDAATMATTVIDNAPVSFADNYQSIFSDGAESIFELIYTAAERSTNGASFFLTRSESGDGFGDGVLREGFIEGIESGDIRFIQDSEDAGENMLRSEVKGPETVTYTLKYNGWNGTSFVDDIAIIRLSEMYLIRAEANAEDNSSIGATPQEDLDKIRTRAGLASVAATVENIMNERRYELAFEGHRFFDLKRKGWDIPKGKEGTDCTKCLLEYDDFRVVDDIAQVELDANPSLVNNPGYQDF